MKLRATFWIRLETIYCTHKKDPHHRNKINVVCIFTNDESGKAESRPWHYHWPISTRCRVCVCLLMDRRLMISHEHLCFPTLVWVCGIGNPILET